LLIYNLLNKYRKYGHTKTRLDDKTWMIKIEIKNNNFTGYKSIGNNFKNYEAFNNQQ